MSTIPIKQVVNKKFVPLVVGSQMSPDIKTQAKLFDDQKIQSFIQDILNSFEQIKEKNSSLYAIRLKATNQYINEKNRGELLCLSDQTRFHEVEICFNLETEVRNFVEKITSLKISNVDALIQQLNSIEKHVCNDRIFAFEFFAKGGKKVLIDFIKECDRTSDNKKWNLLYHLYKILVILIKNWSLISWDMSEIDLPIIKLICDTINDASKENKKALIPDNLVLLFLNIIDDIINNSLHTRDLILKELKFNDLVFIIQRQNIQIKEALLVFLNSCYSKGEENFKKSLNITLTQPLMIVVFREAAKDEKNVDSIFRNISMMQKNILDIDLGARLKASVDHNHLSKINLICKNAFDSNPSATEKQLSDEEKYSKLGFSNETNPLDDFVQMVPPGLLALEFMEYFSTKPSLRSVFLSFFSEKSSKNLDYAFPFAKASIHMIKYLCSWLNIGSSSSNFEGSLNDSRSSLNTDKISMKSYDSNNLTLVQQTSQLNQSSFQIEHKQHELLFIIFTLSNDGIFEFFSKCLWLFQRLWVEMKAQTLDFDRALTALKDSLYKILSDVNKTAGNGVSGVVAGDPNSQTISSLMVKKKLSDFNLLMETWKYDFIKNVKNRFDKSSLAPIRELEKILTDEVIAMIKPKRLHVLCKGEKFDKINSKEKKSKQRQKWTLTSDYKTFNISECDNHDREISNDQLDVYRITGVKKDDSKKQSYILNIICKRLDELGDQHILLASQSEDIIDAWYDGISILINPRPNTNISCFVECLIDAQLLDLHTLNFEIPHDLPKAPKLPTDFNFNLVSS